MIKAGTLFSIVGSLVVLDESSWFGNLIGISLPATIGLYAPLFLALIMFSSFSEKLSSPNFLNNKLFVFLGESSYAVFLFQFPFYLFYMKYLSPLIDAKIEVDFYFFFFTLLIFSAGINKFFEKPIRRLLFTHLS